jgi:regulator of sigma E protease
MLDSITGIAYLLVILSILVIVHEWGHYIVAKLFGMRVEEFSLFFGPVLLRLGKRGDTEYNIRSVPVGGFVRIAGMDPDDVSGGRPILEAIRNPQFQDADPLDRVIRQLDKDTMAGIEASQVSPEVKSLLQGSIGQDGQLTENGRAELEIKQTSASLTDDERKLIQMVLTADTRANDPGLYSQKPIYQRSLVIFAGPFMSLFFGYLLFCLMGMTTGLPTNKITNQVIVMPDGAARAAGMRTGDRIVAINGVPISDGKEMVKKINGSVKTPLRLTINRGGQTVELTATPRPMVRPKYEDNKPVLDKAGKPVKETVGIIGVQPSPILERCGFVTSITEGTMTTVRYVRSLVGMIFSKEVKDNVGGPIAMGQMTTAFQKLGIAHLVVMAASFSLSLGIMNLLPIPILDGGHLVLLAVEKIRRRKLTSREVYRAQLVGLAMLAVIVCLVMYNDISRTIMGKGIQ